MRALVIGGGIAGLAAAVELAEAGADTELWEAGATVGGKLRTSPFGGLPHVDEAADAYLTRVPHAVAFAARVGVTELTSPADAHAAVWHGRLHDVPGGIVLGVPAELRPFATTALLSWRGKARAALEPLLPRRFGRTPAGADSIGALVRGRFGHEVHDRLVDSLVGSIYATDTDRSSLAAVPQLAQLEATNRSLLVGARAQRRRAAAAPTGPIFAAPTAGMGGLAAAAAAAFGAAGGVVRTGAGAQELARDGAGWLVDGERFDAVVLATPARSAAQLVGLTAPDASEALAGIEYADIAMVRLAVPGHEWPTRLAGKSGYLVPKSVQRTVTAASFGSQKWAHWRPADGSQILRVSLGRDGLPIDGYDDAELLERAVTETGTHVGIDLQPTATSVVRWVDAFPQYRPHHAARVAAAQAALPPSIALAGASYHGIGVPACIASGLAAARNLLQSGSPDGPILPNS